MQWWTLFLGGLLMTVSAWADQASELASIHVEVIGGRERIAALKSLRATGFVYAGGKKVRFAQITARPDRVRQEIGTPERSLVQGSDGRTPPWKYDTSALPLRPVDMPPAEAKLFLADVEFDDPLVAGPAAGYALDFAGEFNVKGRKFVRLLVTRKLADTFAVVLDAETFFIVARIDQRTTAGGRKIEVTTRFDDFRPVDGVLLPHRISVQSDGRVTQEIVIEAIEANPPVTPEMFTRPLVALPGKK